MPPKNSLKHLKTKMILLYSCMVLLDVALLIIYALGAFLPSWTSFTYEISLAANIVIGMHVLNTCRLVEMFARAVVHKDKPPHGLGDKPQPQTTNQVISLSEGPTPSEVGFDILS